MNTGHFRINRTEEVPTIEVRLVNGTVWLTKNEIASLFGIFIQAVEGCLKTGFRNGALVEAEVSRTHRYTNKNQQECQTQFYNLEALIFISFHAKSANIAVFRQWIANAVKEHLQKKDTMKAIELSSLLHVDAKYPS